MAETLETQDCLSGASGSLDSTPITEPDLFCLTHSKPKRWDAEIWSNEMIYSQGSQVSFHSIPKKGNAKERSNYRTTASHMLAK